MKGKRHTWKQNEHRAGNKYCTACGLCMSCRPYRYRSPCYGYKRAVRYTWYFRAKVVGEGKRVPFGCGEEG